MTIKTMKTVFGEIKWSFTCVVCGKDHKEGKFMDGTHLRFCNDCIGTADAKKTIANEKRRQTMLKKKYGVTDLHTCGDIYCNDHDFRFSPVDGFYCFDCAWVNAHQENQSVVDMPEAPPEEV